MQTLAHCWILTVFFAFSDQNPQGPLPKGRTITVRDGDTILVDGDQRVGILRRRQGIVRAVFNEPGRWLVLLADLAKPDSDPDGRVDATYNFRDVTGTWPLAARWEGQAVIEEHSALPGVSGPHRGVLLRTADGVIQLVSGSPQNPGFEEPAIAVLTHRGSGWGMSAPLTFDQAEQRAIADLERNLANNAERAKHGLPSVDTFSSVGPTGSVTTGALVGPSITPRTDAAPLSGGGPGRVRGGLRTPKKIYDVPPVLPEDARRAGVRGMVILELTVGADGTVTDAKVLRSIPLLDKAALDAARQWRYEPTLLDNQPVPIVVTAVVNFN